MFNLRRYAEKDVETSEAALDSQRENLEKVTGPYSALLEKLHKNKDDGKEISIEGELKEIRHNEKLETTEAQLEGYDPGDDMPKRTGNDKFDQLPINMLEEKAHQSKIKAFRSSTVKDDTEFWDELLTSSDVDDITSQLQNHTDRFKNIGDDVLKNEGVRKMVMASLKDADAMLYHIYREAAAKGRELTKNETSLVAGITADKIKIVEKLVN